MDWIIAVFTPLPKPTQSSESPGVEKKHYGKDHDITINSSNMLSDGHILEHAQYEGISLLGIESCCTIGELIHHMVCWKEHYHIWY